MFVWKQSQVGEIKFVHIMVLIGWVRPQWEMKLTKDCIDKILIYLLKGRGSKNIFLFI